jgi:type II secretory pathway component GspD/PulD (secretin)
MKNIVHWTRDYNDGYKIMTSSGQKISCSQWLIAAVTVAVVLLVGGCGDPLGENSTGAQAQSIINDLSRIEPVSEPNISVPEIYKEPPKIVEQIVGGTPEFKLAYFCMYHTSDELKKIVHEQFATKLFDKKGKETKLVDYTVSSVAATNQLIVRCPKREDATAVLELLEMVDVPPIQVKIDCLISEVYADMTLDWETTLEIENLFGEDIRAGSSAQPFGTGVTELVKEGTVLTAFPGASLRDLARTQMGLQIGYWSESENFLAMVDLLESKGYLKILMHPTLEVVNGKTAKISSIQHVPLQKITKYIRVEETFLPQSETEYIDVVDSLEITPHVFADGYIGLETSILLGSKLTPEGVKQLPIVTKKEIENKENRIRKGESLVIGGIRKTEKRDVVRGVPFLKDIPIVGMLFSGRDFEERVVETIFILTPSISTGGIPNKEMVEKVKRKHRSPTSDGLDEIIADPFGFEAGEKERQLEASEVERIRLEAEAEKARSRYALREAEEHAKRAEAELNRVKAEAEAKVKAAEEAVEKAKEEAERAKKEEEK